VFGNLTDFWRERALKYGDRYIGHISENYKVQQARIEALLRQRVNPAVPYEDMLDLGCGWGRFLPFWGQFTGHIWAVDLLPDMLEKARCQIPNVTSLRAGWPFKLPLADGSINLLWACFVFQDIKDHQLLGTILAELNRVLAANARVLILDNGKLRKPEVFVDTLSLRPGWQTARVTINKTPQDTWLIDGARG
jgi:ubiquinone/menaquinone biosynthesis C-methylase UbiE